MRRVIEVDGLFDGTRAIANAAIVVDDGLIASAGPRGKAPTKDTATLHRPKDVWVRGAPSERPGTRAT